MEKRQAILLLGPTGSGKTPLGELLDSHGLAGRRCLHFDFGQQLRLIAAAAQPPAGLTQDQSDFVRSVLQTGALLEDEHFCIAEKILTGFLAERNTGRGDLVILNGLPRHIGQADAMDALLDVRALVVLNCDAATIVKRIHTNAGGDRAERTDDDIGFVRRKLDVFAQRTIPLVEHYAKLGAETKTIQIGPRTSADDVLAVLNSSNNLTQ